MSPNTVRKLYKQRVRWIYGFLKNAQDYRELFFNKKYGNIGFFALPAGVISILTVMYVFLTMIINLVTFFVHKTVQVQAIGFSSLLHFKHFDWFFINTATITFIAILLSAALLVSLLLGRKMVEGKMRLSWNIIYFFILSATLAPIWLSRAVYNALFGQQSDWKAERAVL